MILEISVSLLSIGVISLVYDRLRYDKSVNELIVQNVELQIIYALKVYKETSFVTWANNWLNNVDRTELSAESAAESAAYAAVRAARASVQSTEAQTVEAAYAAVRAARAAAGAAK